MSIKVYIAGPEVFLPDAAAVMARKAELTRAAGFIPLCPGDLDLPRDETRRNQGVYISRVNEGMMREADAVIANLTPFRGIAADVGTTFELGFMCALEKHVFAYTNVEAMHLDRIAGYYDGEVDLGEDGRIRGADGLSVEDFDMVDNLMLDGGILARGGTFVIGNARKDELYSDTTGFERCLAILAERVAALEGSTPIVRGRRA